MLIYAGGTSQSRTVDSVTVNGSAATALIATQANAVGANGIHARLFGHVTPTTGNVVVTWSGATTCTARSVTFTGAHASAPFGTPVASATVDDDVSSASGDLVSDGIVVDMGDTCAGLTLTVGASQAERGSQLCTDNTSRLATSTEPGAGTVTMSWTVADEVLHIAVNVIQAAGGGATVAPQRLGLLGVS
jgi:hypothetical protein